MKLLVDIIHNNSSMIDSIDMHREGTRYQRKQDQTRNTKVQQIQSLHRYPNIKSNYSLVWFLFFISKLL